MTRTSAWLALIAVVLSAAACHAQEGRPRRLLLPRLSGRPSQVWAADVADQPGTPQGQALPPPTQNTPAPGTPAATTAPVLFPADPFPPPAPPVLDPRTLAWQQVNGPAGPAGLLHPGAPHHGPAHVPAAAPAVSAAPVRMGSPARVRVRQAPAAWPEVHARQAPAAWAEIHTPRAPVALPPVGSTHAVEGVPEPPAPLRRAGWSEPGTQTSSDPASTCSGPY